MRVAVTVTSPSDGRASSASCTASPVASAAMGAVVQGSPFSSVPKLLERAPGRVPQDQPWPRRPARDRRRVRRRHFERELLEVALQRGELDVDHLRRFVRREPGVARRRLVHVRLDADRRERVSQGDNMLQALARCSYQVGGARPGSRPGRCSCCSLGLARTSGPSRRYLPVALLDLLCHGDVAGDLLFDERTSPSSSSCPTTRLEGRRSAGVVVFRATP